MDATIKPTQKSLYSFVPKLTDFINPRHEESPIKVSEFLKTMDLAGIMGIILSKYQNDYHFRYPPAAMIKSIILMRLKKIKSFPKLADYLQAHKECIINLGFNPEILPSKKTLWHFAAKRLDKSWRVIISRIIEEIKQRLNVLGIKLGDSIVVDATPIEALRNDKEAVYNGHYKKLMYKLYVGVDPQYRLPLAYDAQLGTASDCDHLIPLLLQVTQKGIEFNYVYADGAFESFGNFADVHVRFSANFRTNLGESSMYYLNEEGTPEIISYYYEKSWKKAPHYKPSKSINYDVNYMMSVLVDINEKYCVGNYFRNSLIRELEESPTEYLEEYKSTRTCIEEFNGHFKEQLQVEANLNRKGLKNVTQYLEMCLFSYVSVALNRVQHGITEGLTDLGGLV